MNQKLHIVFLDFDDIQNPLLGAGQARATYEVGRRLAQNGHTVTSICSRYPGYTDRVEAGIHYRHIGLGSGNIKLNNVAYIFALPFTVARLRADIIIECFTAPISTLFSPLFTRIPVLALPSMFNAKEFVKKYHLPFHLIERIGLPFYKYMAPYSDIDQKKAMEINPRLRCRIIPQGVSEEFFSIPSQKPEHILFLGRLDIAQKGIDLLLHAYSKIADRTPYPLVIAGHGSDEHTVRTLIRQLHLEGRVRMVGPTYGAMKSDILAKSVCTAFPSRHDELCLWTLESLAAGLPIVAFDIPESQWLREDVALKAPPFDIDRYADALLRLTEPGLRTTMSTNARVFAKQYTWERVVHMFEDFFEEILSVESMR
jgi:glycosyltransferase involved in cell wall biosynthesis